MKLNKKLLDIFKTTQTTSDTDTYSCNYMNTQLGNKQPLVNYSTSEVDTGVKWIDGKTIYRKVIHKSNVEKGYRQFNHDISNLGTLISATGSISYTFSNSARQDFIPNVVADNVTGWGASILNIESVKFALLLGTSYPTTNEVYVVLEYTKTTD